MARKGFRAWGREGCFRGPLPGQEGNWRGRSLAVGDPEPVLNLPGREPHSGGIPEDRRGGELSDGLGGLEEGTGASGFGTPSSPTSSPGKGERRVCPCFQHHQGRAGRRTRRGSTARHGVLPSLWEGVHRHRPPRSGPGSPLHAVVLRVPCSLALPTSQHPGVGTESELRAPQLSTALKENLKEAPSLLANLINLS